MMPNELQEQRLHVQGTCTTCEDCVNSARGLHERKEAGRLQLSLSVNKEGRVAPSSFVLIPVTSSFNSFESF